MYNLNLTDNSNVSSKKAASNHNPTESGVCLQRNLKIRVSFALMKRLNEPGSANPDKSCPHGN